MEQYFAKSNPPVRNQTHLQKVSVFAAQYGREIGQEEMARIAGLFHDFGKNGERFAGVLQGIRRNIDHALPGAAFLYTALRLNSRETLREKYGPILEAISAHHDGLQSLDCLEPYLIQALTNPSDIVCPSGKTAALSGPAEYENAAQAFLRDFPGFQFPKLPAAEAASNLEAMLDSRMLLSCLVDADYTVSALDTDPDYLQKSSGSHLDAEQALIRLYAHRLAISQDSKANRELNAQRDQVFFRCGELGQLPPGLFSMTAPTGIGKTLAMLHFALRHCQANQMRRIIVVLPFLTLAEQSEKEYRRIIPDLLVDHSQSRMPEDMRELAARWDAPVMITTSVRFFESLFSDRPTDCRKLHNIAGSIILFDEAQSLPAVLAPATIQAVQRLCRKYRCSMVFSTATQPDFSALPGTVWRPTELIADVEPLYGAMRRTNVEWRLQQGTPLSQIADQMSGLGNVCTIVNLRRHARSLFAELQERCSGEGLYLLSNDLCPIHRLAVVEEIKHRRMNGQPCRVVATQCIEAGVDLDFDVLYRALAPLEAIIQAAGRCNRNGRLPGGGRVVVFEPDEAGNLYPGPSYEHAASIVKTLLSRSDLDLNSPAQIQAYYQELYRDLHEDGELQRAMEAKDYPSVARAYRLITKQGVHVIVPWQGALTQFEEIRREALDHGLTAGLLRESAPLTVSCFEREWVEQHATPLYFAGKAFREKTESGYYVLNIGHETSYDAVTGLKIDSNLPELYMV